METAHTIRPREVQEHLSTDNIGINEGLRSFDGVVDMTLGGEMYDMGRRTLFKESPHRIAVAYIALHKAIIRSIGDSNMRRVGGVR